MKFGIKCLLAALTICVAGPAQARDQFGARDAVVIDPQKSYIFYRTEARADVVFLREPDEEQLTAWENARRVAYTRARTRYERLLARYEHASRVYARRSPSQRAGMIRPQPPEEVTFESFPYPPPELDNFVTVAAGRQFTRDGAYNTYLMAVPPGSYILYGTEMGGQHGPYGSCNCMGSVRFAAPAGRIVDLGEIGYSASEAGSAARLMAVPNSLISEQAIIPFNPDMTRPERLPGQHVIAADYRAAGKMPNYRGILIARLQPLANVLAYRRDEVIDLKAEGE